VGYYTWKVEERNQHRRDGDLLRSVRPQVGSVDDMASDQLNVGDLVVFERDCSALHLPQALHCLVTKQLLRESCDHVGIVFLDSKTKLPSVLEAVPWVGVKATPFVGRVAAGTDSVISVLPLVLPKPKPIKRTEKVAPRSWWRWGNETPTSNDNKETITYSKNDPALIRERRVHERINVFCRSAQSSDKIPTTAKDSVGLVLNAYLAAKIMDPDPILTRVTPGQLSDGKVPLLEGITWGESSILRSLQ